MANLVGEYRMHNRICGQRSFTIYHGQFMAHQYKIMWLEKAMGVVSPEGRWTVMRMPNYAVFNTLKGTTKAIVLLDILGLLSSAAVETSLIITWYDDNSIDIDADMTYRDGAFAHRHFRLEPDLSIHIEPERRQAYWRS